MALVRNSKSAPALGSEHGDMVKYVDATAVAPAPSRDYYRLEVTDAYVRLTRWQISHKGRSSASLPIETKVALDKYHKTHLMVTEVGRVFGKELCSYVWNLSQGHMDWIVRLPTRCLARIVEYVGIKNLSTLATICKRFEEVTSCNILWKAFYYQYCHPDLPWKPVVDQGDFLGWKKAFFVNRLQKRVFPGKKMRLGRAAMEGPVKSGIVEIPKVVQRLLQQERQKVIGRRIPSTKGVSLTTSLTE